MSDGVGINFRTGPSNRRGAPVDSGDRSGDRSLAPYGDAKAKAERRVMDRYRRLLRDGDTTAARAVASTAYDLGLDVGGEVARQAEQRPGATKGVQMSRADADLAREKHQEDYDNYKRALGLGADEDANRGLAAGGR